MASQKTWAHFLIAAIGLACLIVPNDGASLTSPPKPAENKCTDDDCIVERLEAATHVMKYRDSSVDPCDNFYRFVCGNYEGTDYSHNPSYVKEIRDFIIASLIGIDEAMTSGYKPFKLIEDLHDTCMDQSARGEQAVNLMKAVITHLGGWPVLEGDKWKEDGFDWINFVGESKKSGYVINYFVDWEPELAQHDDDQILVFKLKPSPAYFEYEAAIDKDRPYYQEYMSKIARAMGLEGTADEELDKVYEFEKKLHAITKKMDSDGEDAITIADAKSKWPGLDWDNFVAKTLTPFADKEETPVITVWNSEALNEFINLMASTPKRVQANYAIWRLIQQTVSFLTPEFTKEQDAFHKLIDANEPADEKFCDEIAEMFMEEAMTYFFIDAFKHAADSVQNMVQTIKNSMVQMIEDSKVLDAEDKADGTKKILDMPVTMGPSERYSDPKELELLYAEAEVDKTNFLQTLLNMNMFKIVLDYSSKLTKEMHFGEHQIEGFETPVNNDDHLYIPPGMMASSFFNHDRPMYMNYGTGGVPIAKEIFESVNGLGRVMNEKKEEIPTENVQCFQNLFNNATDPDTNKPLELSSVDYLISRYIAFRAARGAYNEYRTGQGAELPLPEVPYTPEQLFWIAHTGSFCNSNPELEDEKDVEGTDMKTLEFIMMKVFSQIPEISADFSCPIGSNMNPEQKCEWW